MKVRDCETQQARVELAEATDAQVIKDRLLKFLRMPSNEGARLFYEWEEVVECLLDDESCQS